MYFVHGIGCGHDLEKRFLGRVTHMRHIGAGHGGHFVAVEDGDRRQIGLVEEFALVIGDDHHHVRRGRLEFIGEAVKRRLAQGRFALELLESRHIGKLAAGFCEQVFVADPATIGEVQPRVRQVAPRIALPVLGAKGQERCV